MKTNLIVRLVEDRDKEEVLKLLNGVFSKQQRSENSRDDSYWNWKFKSSMFAPSILTVAEDCGRIVGVDHLWPWELSYQGEILKAVQPCDAVVHEDYRGHGLFKQMRRFGIDEAISREYQFVFNFPNENSLPGNRSIGAKYLGKITWWVKILKPVHILLDTFFSLKIHNVTLPESYQLDCDYLDHLSHKTSIDQKIIQIHRKKGFHHWRYKNHPSRQYGMALVGISNKQTAFIFTVIQQGSRREMVVVDIVGDLCSKKSIVNSMTQVAKRMDADFIAVMENKLLGIKKLWKHGFIKKRLKNMVVLPLNDVDGAKMSSFDQWSLLACIHDSI